MGQVVWAKAKGRGQLDATGQECLLSPGSTSFEEFYSEGKGGQKEVMPFLWGH